MKKQFIRAAAFICAVTLLGLAGCWNNITQLPVQSGMGRVVVTVNNQDARTVAPSLDIFTKFTLSFSGPVSQAPIDIVDGIASIELIPGQWTITATGYTGIAPNFVAAAEGSVVVTVVAGETTSAFILLSPKDADEKGFFEYKITVPAASDTAVIGILGESVTNLAAGLNEGILELAPGQYVVYVNIEKGDLVIPGFLDALHIYTGQTTYLELEYKDEDFLFTINDGFDLTGFITPPVMYETPDTTEFETDQFTGTVEWQTMDGEPVDGIFRGGTKYKAVITLTPKPGYTFWKVGADSFTYDGAVVTNDENSGIVTIVFPETEAEVPGTINITIGFNYGQILVDGSDGINIIYKDGEPAFLALVTDGYDNVTWYVDGKPVPVTVGPEITINAADYKVGPHSVSFIGYKGGNLYGQPVPFTVKEEFSIYTNSQLTSLISDAKAAIQGIYVSSNGSGVPSVAYWVPEFVMDTMNDMIAAAEVSASTEKKVSESYTNLSAALDLLGFFKTAGGSANVYYRDDPGLGLQNINASVGNNVWARNSTVSDNRIPSNTGTFSVIAYPFADVTPASADLLLINYVHNGSTTFGGISLNTGISPTLTIPSGAQIEFDVYYPKSAQGKYMRWRVWAAGSGSSSNETYMREYEYNNLNPDWVGSYSGETWLKATHSIAASTGSATTIKLELHGETSRPAETGQLMVGNMRITIPDPNGVALPNVANGEAGSSVTPLKSLYNRNDGLFMVGAIGTGTLSSIATRHYEIFVDGNNLKADSIHPRAPSWLRDVNNTNFHNSTSNGSAEFSWPTSSYQSIVTNTSGGVPAGTYKVHGHTMAWYNQAPSWMTRIHPATLPQGYSGTTEFYGLGNSVNNTNRVSKEMARRVQFNHIVYTMRHFYVPNSTKYGSSGRSVVIPFNSWDILNEEIHESRHSELIPGNPNEWRLALKHTNWLVALSDDEISGDVANHYIYLLFKYAHIAIPNAQMAAAYKANYASLPDYMKQDGHDDGGSIDAYIVANPPKVTYNDYGIATNSKARVAYNMIRELNTRWQSDLLYDGRPLIEDMGIQGHDSLGAALASNNQYAIALYAKLIDEGLLSGISYSEFDIKMPTNAPGGGATAPAALNTRQSDALGYQYALMYKLFTKFAPYIDHVISWGLTGSGWQGSYVLFDSSSRANAGYYGAMNPDMYITGHGYLDYFYTDFAGVREYDKIKDGYVIDLGDLGTYVR